MPGRRHIVLPIGLVGFLAAPAQLNVSINQTPVQLVQDVLLGQGVSVSNISYNGVLNPGTPQAGSGSFVTVNSNLGLSAGIILASGNAENVAQPEGSFMSDQPDNYTDPDLELISGGVINNAAVLEFDFVPTGDSLTFRYVFGSEEYPEWVCSFNDVFGFFLSGPGISGGLGYQNDAINIALVPNSTTYVGVNSINNGDNDVPNDPFCPAVNPQYYVNNDGGGTVVFDAFTVVLEARAQVQCGNTYHIKLAIGDALDQAFDSGVFLEAGSFASSGQVIPALTAGVSVNDSTMFEGCGQIPMEFRRLGDTANVDTIFIAIGGTSTPGVDYAPAFPDFLVYQPGDTMIIFPLNVPLDADVMETLTITIAQNIVCSGTQVTNEYVFYIDSYPPLDLITTDTVPGDCGGSYLLQPTVNGGTGLYQYLWSTGATTPTITVSPGVTTTYSVQVSDTCGVVSVNDDITVTMPVYPPLSMEVSPLTLIDCLGTGDIAVTDVGGGNGDYAYSWTLDGAPVGTGATINVPAAQPSVWYIATVTDGCGSTLSDSVEVGTAPLAPIVITAPDRTAICAGDSIVLNVVDVTGGNGVYTYQWTSAGGTVLSTADSVVVWVPVDGTYTITVQDQCGYAGALDVDALIPHPEPFILAFNPDTVLCLGASLELHAVVSGGSGYYHIEWPGMDHTDPILLVSPEVNRTYQVVIHDQCGEIVSDVVNVGVEQPTAKILASNAGQDDWQFVASTEPTFCRSYRWDLGDGTLARNQVVSHSYLDLDEHWVHLSIVSYNGCPAVDSFLVRPPGAIYFPNAFTPDGDGLNEFFGPRGKYVEEFEMLVFNRWGEQVFSTNAIDRPWDGRVNGTEAMTGVYVYKFKASGHLMPAMEGFGHVTLLRGSGLD